MPQENYAKRLEIAIDAARQAAEVQRRNYQSDFSVDTKSSGIDLVTSIDRQCDDLIQDVLMSRSTAEQLPETTMLTEESFEDGDIDFTRAWLVDPLDGTTNYAHGFPHFAVSIAFMENGQPVVGVILDPMKEELFTAIQGEGAFMNDRPLKVSNAESLESALLATGFPYDRQVKPEENMGYFMRFMSICHGVRRAGSAALDLAYVACARLDGFWELRLSPWDVAAGSLIVREAGGRVSDFGGEPLAFDQRKIDILGANNETLHQQIIHICSQSPAEVF